MDPIYLNRYGESTIGSFKRENLLDNLILHLSFFMIRWFPLCISARRIRRYSRSMGLRSELFWKTYHFQNTGGMNIQMIKWKFHQDQDQHIPIELDILVSIGSDQNKTMTLPKKLDRQLVLLHQNHHLVSHDPTIWFSTGTSASWIGTSCTILSWFWQLGKRFWVSSSTPGTVGKRFHASSSTSDVKIKRGIPGNLTFSQTLPRCSECMDYLPTVHERWKNGHIQWEIDM